MTDDQTPWSEANLQCLMAAIRTIRARLAASTADTTTSESLDPPVAYERLRTGFGLSAFELAVVLVAAGVELDPDLADLVLAANDTGDGLPTLGFALRTLPGAHWAALTPSAALRRWRLIELGQADRVTATPYRVSERTLHFLLGIDYLPPQLADLIEPVELPTALPESYRSHAERAVAEWGASGLLCLEGEDGSAVRAVGAAAANMQQIGLYRMDASRAPALPSESATAQRLWEREALMCQSALLVTDDTSGDPGLLTAARNFVRGLRCPVIAPPALLPGPGGPPVTRVRITPLTVPERRAMWQYALGPQAGALNGRVDELIAQFPLAIDQYSEVAAQALSLAGADTATVGDRLWDACRMQSRAPMGRLAQRIESTAPWTRLVLPPEQLSTLHEIAAHVRYRSRVHKAWGFGEQLRRSPGVSVLFTGPSGTGKTLAAEVLAADLQLDLYRVDLSQLVSKYIGETEKNLSAVFDAAELSGAILLFDEADALFGKRTAVRDSHDRYANIEVSYLLQRMESYRGLAILTTNQRTALDQAFLRRLRFVVTFPFPDEAHRAGIWARVLPSGTPVAEVSVERLARLSVSGGNISNIALHAAFLAAAEDQPVRMTHLLRAARTECAKIEKPLTAAEVGGWT
jgi:ATPase family associated with various cellular activities (AAA)